MIRSLRLRLSNFGLRVSGCEFQVSGCEFQVTRNVCHALKYFLTCDTFLNTESKNYNRFPLRKTLRTLRLNFLHRDSPRFF